jgi:hypothetical protein
LGIGVFYTGFFWVNLREKSHSVDPRVDGRIILRLIFRKWNKGVGTGLIWLRIEIGGGICDCDNETSGFIK